jgi:hypothetical protein
MATGEMSEQEVEKMLQDEDDSLKTPEARQMVSTGTNTSTGELSARAKTISTSSTSSCTVTNSSGLPRAYFNVRAARKNANTVRPLTGSEVLTHDLGTFESEGDDRYLLANHRHCFSAKANICTSFELDTMVCNTCTTRGRHRVLRRETERPDTVNDSPICFVLSDQCFPPVLPLEGGRGGNA